MPTGVAIIMVDDDGENSIVVIPGANNSLLPIDIEEAREIVETAQIVMLQLEIPMETVEAVIAWQKRRSTGHSRPWSSRPLAKELLAQVDIITPNEHEAQVLAGKNT